MAEKKISQKIELAGEKEYSAALKEAQRNLKTLKSALKAETAELGSNATAQQKNETKIKSLKKQISEQEKIVKTYTDALKEVREKYADNEDEIAKWETKLNNARTTLANMKNDLDKSADSIENASDKMADLGDSSAAGVTASKSFADAIGSISSAAEGISEKIESIFSGVTNAVVGAAEAVWGEVVNLAAKANNWSDLATFWNTTPEKVRQFEAGIQASGNTFEEFSQMVTKFALADKDKIWEFAGVRMEGNVDELEYIQMVMKNLSEMDYQQQQAAIGGIFGSSAKNFQKVLDLVGDWEEVEKGMEKYDPNGVFGLTDEQIEQFNKINTQIAGIETSWNALEEKMTAGFVGEIALQLTGDVQGIIDAFAMFMDADTEEEKAAALEEFKAKLEEFFRDIGEAIAAAAEAIGEVGEGLENSEDSILKVLGGLLTGFSDTLKWLSDEKNWGAVRAAFDGLVAVWAGAKVATAIGNIAQFAANMSVISGFKMAGVAAAGEAATAGTAAGSAWASAFWAAAKVAAPALAFFYTWGENALKPQGNDDFIDENGQLTEVAKASGYTLTESGELVGDDSIREEMAWYRKGKELTRQKEEAAAVAEAMEKMELSGTNTYHIPEEIEEDVDLDAAEVSREAAEFAIQDWWDALRAYQLGLENPKTTDEELDALSAAVDEAQAMMEEYLGPDFAEVYSGIAEKLDRTINQNKLEDIPEDWYGEVLDAISWKEDDGLSSEDVTGFRALPGRMTAAVKEGVAGIQVYMDGEKVGHLVAGTVSEDIAAAAGW